MIEVGTYVKYAQGNPTTYGVVTKIEADGLYDVEWIHNETQEKFHVGLYHSQWLTIVTKEEFLTWLLIEI